MLGRLNSPLLLVIVVGIARVVAKIRPYAFGTACVAPKAMTLAHLQGTWNGTCYSYVDQPIPGGPVTCRETVKTSPYQIQIVGSLAGSTNGASVLPLGAVNVTDSSPFLCTSAAGKKEKCKWPAAASKGKTPYGPKPTCFTFSIFNGAVVSKAITNLACVKGKLAYIQESSAFLNGQAERVCRRSANGPFDDGRPPFYCNGQGTKGIWNEICVAYKVASPSPVVSPSPVMT